jgi:putative endonuclease
MFHIPQLATPTPQPKQRSLRPHQLGRRGEELAARYLTEQGWVILDRNWRCSLGEIDLVGLDGRQLVVVEVKTRSSLRAGTALEAVTTRKVRRLRRLAGLWLAERERGWTAVRIDAVGIHMAVDRTFTIEHIRGVV